MLITPDDHVLFHLLGGDIWNSCSITFSGTKVWLNGLKCLRSFSFPLLKTRVVVTFLQSSGTSPIFHDLSQVIDSSLAITSAHSLCTCWCTLSRPINFCMLFALIGSSLPTGKSLVPQTLLSLGPWIPEEKS